jgi:hypothetical protein
MPNPNLVPTAFSPDCGEKFGPRPSGRGVATVRCRPCPTLHSSEGRLISAPNMRAVWYVGKPRVAVMPKPTRAIGEWMRLRANCYNNIFGTAR